MAANTTDLNQPVADTESNNGRKAAPTVCETTLISDTPYDEFTPGGEGPHEKVAGAIVDLLRGSDGGISVGLEGSWGAGKTSVVWLLLKKLSQSKELIEPGGAAPAAPPPSPPPPARAAAGGGDGGRAVDDESEERKKFAVILFDAWAAEKDPLRRTFLETLIPHLQKIGWVDHERWERRQHIIAQRLERKSTESRPRLSRAGMVAAILFLLLTPVGGYLFSDALKTSKFVIDTSRPFAWRLLFGLTLMWLPALVVLAVYVPGLLKDWWESRGARRAAGTEARRAPADAARPRAKRPTLWSMLLNKGVTSELTSTFKTTNPTSIEFEDLFTRLMQEALEGVVKKDRDEEDEDDGRRAAPTILPAGHSDYVKRRVVLILDNLDRVEASDALTIWSTLQTFLGRPRGPHEKWFKRLWVVVLYDPRGLRMLWDKSDAQNSAGPPSPAGATGTTAVAAAAGAAGGAAGLSTNTVPLSAGASQPRQQPAQAQASADAGRPAAQTRPASAPQADDGDARLKERAAPGATSTSFIDKSFQIRFEVPPPVLSDWRDSLTKFLGDALMEEVHGREFHLVHRVLARHLAETGQYPTFRELKLFVNQIGALHRQWSAYCLPDPKRKEEDDEKKFPLSHLAYYVILRRRGVDVIKLVTEGKLPEDGYEGILGDGARATLAALAFNVRRRKALQIILSDPIERALLLGNEQGGKELAESRRNHDGFWEALQGVVDPDSGLSTDGDSRRRAQEKRSGYWLSQATQTLLRSRLLDEAEGRSPLAANVVQTLCENAARVRTWSPFNKETAAGLAALCRWKRELGVGELSGAPGQPFELSLLRSLSSSLGYEGEESPKRAAEAWRNNLSTVSTEAALNLSTGGTPPEARASALIEPLVSQLKPKADGHYHTPRTMDFILQVEALLALSEFDTIFETLAAEKELGELVADGHVLHFLGSIDLETHSGKVDAFQAQPIVRCLYLNLLFDPNLSEPPETGRARFGYERLLSILSWKEPDNYSVVPASFVALLAEHERLPFLLRLLEITLRSLEVEPFVAQCLVNLLASNEHSLALFDPATLVEKWPTLYRLVNGGARPLNRGLSALIANEPASELAGRIADFASKRSVANDGDYAWLYAEALRSPEVATGLREQTLRWMVELQSVAASRWRQEMRDWGGLYELLLTLRAGGHMPAAPAPYKEAVIETARAALKGEKFEKLRLGPVPTAALDTSADEGVFSEIESLVVEADGDISEPFFELYGEALAGRLPRHVHGVTVGSYLFKALLGKRNAAGLRWMKEVLENFQHPPPGSRPDFWEPISNVMREVVRDALQQRVEDEAQQAVAELAKLLDLDKPAAAAPSKSGAALPVEVSEEERRVHERAHRFAHLLVSEIKLYNQQKVWEGREAGDLYNRLREDIDRSRAMYDKRYAATPARSRDYFHQELVESLAEGDPSKLGEGYPGDQSSAPE